MEEPADDVAVEADADDTDDADDTPLAAPSWLGAFGQMIAAVLVVVAVVSLFIVVAAALRRLVP